MYFLLSQLSSLVRESKINSFFSATTVVILVAISGTALLLLNTDVEVGSYDVSVNFDVKRDNSALDPTAFWICTKVGSGAFKSNSNIEITTSFLVLVSEVLFSTHLPFKISSGVLRSNEGPRMPPVRCVDTGVAIKYKTTFATPNIIIRASQTFCLWDWRCRLSLLIDASSSFNFLISSSCLLTFSLYWK